MVLDMVALQKEATYFKQHVVIARFLVALFTMVRHELWIHKLED